MICAGAILVQLEKLLNFNDVSADIYQKIKTIFSLKTPLPAFNAQALCLSNSGHNDIMNAIHLAFIGLNKNSQIISVSVFAHIEFALMKIIEWRSSLINQIKTVSVATQNFDEAAYDCVEQYSQIHIVLTNIFLWLYNLGEISDYFDEGEWLVLAINNINKNLSQIDKPERQAFQQKAVNQIKQLVQENKSFNIGER